MIPGAFQVSGRDTDESSINECSSLYSLDSSVSRPLTWKAPESSSPGDHTHRSETPGNGLLVVSNEFGDLLASLFDRPPPLLPLSWRVTAGRSNKNPGRAFWQR